MFKSGVVGIVVDFVRLYVLEADPQMLREFCNTSSSFISTINAMNFGSSVKRMYLLNNWKVTVVSALLPLRKFKRTTISHFEPGS